MWLMPCRVDMLAKACRLDGLMLSMLSSELSFMIEECLQHCLFKNFRLKTLLSNSTSWIPLTSAVASDTAAWEVWISSYLKIVVSLCNSWLFMTIQPSSICQMLLESQVPSSLSDSYFIFTRSFNTQLSFVATPNTMTAQETPTSTNM